MDFISSYFTDVLAESLRFCSFDSSMTETFYRENTTWLVLLNPQNYIGNSQQESA